MRLEWLIRRGRKQLLLFFSGWGMDGRPFRRIASHRYDVALVFDYRDLDRAAEVVAAVHGYAHYQLVAWSLGVWVAGRMRPHLPDPDRSLAINGTSSPIDRALGIAPSVFEATLRTLPACGCDPFYRNMFSAAADFEAFQGSRPERELDDQHQELQRLRDSIVSEPRPAAHWNVAWIGAQDVIVPARSQLRFWQGRAACRVRKAGHFPFLRWDRWEDLIDESDRE